MKKVQSMGQATELSKARIVLLFAQAMAFTSSLRSLLPPTRAVFDRIIQARAFGGISITATLNLFPNWASKANSAPVEAKNGKSTGIAINNVFKKPALFKKGGFFVPLTPPGGVNLLFFHLANEQFPPMVAARESYNLPLVPGCRT
jgi:hypothetical protein